MRQETAYFLYTEEEEATTRKGDYKPLWSHKNKRGDMSK